jgi:hypothetical protein
MSRVVAFPGQPNSNAIAIASALKIVAAFRKDQHLPDDLTRAEIEGEKLKALTAALCFWRIR